MPSCCDFGLLHCMRGGGGGCWFCFLFFVFLGGVGVVPSCCNFGFLHSKRVILRGKEGGWGGGGGGASCAQLL